MAFEQSAIDGLIASPTESLNVEVKRWIDPSQTAGQAKIIKGALGLRNRNGGYFVIGFDDQTLQPDTAHQPANIRGAFHQDTIQGLISNYSSETFEITIAYGVRNGAEYPIIVVPPGVKTPVAAKRNLIENNKTLIRSGAVYFRTLNANGTPSTSEARPEDWREIMEICFDNREADIGRFLRRHLAGQDITSLLAKFGQIGAVATPPPKPTLCERAVKLLGEGEVHYQAALKARTLTAGESELAKCGSWDVALIIDPARSNAKPDRTFLSTIASSNPHYTGWPIWFDSNTASEPLNRPVVASRAWQALILSIVKGWSAHLDFWRLDPKGEFYLHRVLQDDGVPDRVAAGTALDPVIVILRVAEVIAVSLAFAKALGWNPETTTLGFAFKWRKLAGRQLTRWADPFDSIGGGTAHQDEITTYTELLLDTPLSAIAPAVEKAVQDLFVLFGGAQISSSTIEDWVRRLIERRLN